MYYIDIILAAIVLFRFGKLATKRGPFCLLHRCRNGVLINGHMHVAEEGRGVSLWINPDRESADFRALIEAGDPVWYRIEPERVAPGGIAEVTLQNGWSSTPVRIDALCSRETH